jgi:hypothetical protein
MKPTKRRVIRSSAKKVAAKPGANAVPETGSNPAAELPVELDRRGKPLPPRQRVGGIITPQ